jgi:hypothetical protein
MFDIGYGNFNCSNNVEMRKIDLVNVGEELYEVVKRVSIHKFTKQVAGENADILKEYYGSEKILRSNQTNEYLFVNLIEEAKLINDDEQRTS